MHFEVPKAKKLKEFGGEYLMIVISIITALALEHMAQAWHRHHLADEAVVKIDHEIRANIAEVGSALEHNEARYRSLKAVREELLEGIRNKVDDAVLMKRFSNEWADALSYGVRSPSLRREAWESSVASQTASWMPQATLERYSTVYATMRDVQAIEYGGGNNFLDLPRYLDTMSNLQMGETNPRDLYRILGQMMSSYIGADGNLVNLRKELGKALEPASGGH